jgi:hypothetical protein
MGPSPAFARGSGRHIAVARSGRSLVGGVSFPPHPCRGAEGSSPAPGPIFSTGACLPGVSGRGSSHLGARCRFLSAAIADTDYDENAKLSAFARITVRVPSGSAVPERIVEMHYTILLCGDLVQRWKHFRRGSVQLNPWIRSRTTQMKESHDC